MRNILIENQPTHTHDEPKMPGIMRFYYQYQIIEILIQEVFESEFDEIVKQLSDNVENLFDVRERLRDISNEKYRIKRLFHSFAKADYDELGHYCKLLLERSNRKIEGDIPSNIYSVRNLLVHKLYSLTEDSENGLRFEELIDLINNALNEVLLEMIFSFRKSRD